jgi:Dual specificity phosphatase, catalytic domain/UBA/TS-N domain
MSSSWVGGGLDGFVGGAEEDPLGEELSDLSSSDAWLRDLMRAPNLQEPARIADPIIDGECYLGSSSAARALGQKGETGELDKPEDAEAVFEVSMSRAVVNCAGAKNNNVGEGNTTPDGTIDGVACYDLGELERLGVRYLELPMEDGVKGPPIGEFLRLGADFVQRCVAEGASPVLVHCSAGKSRSAAVVAAYLVKHKGFSLRDAMLLMRGRRERAYPRLHFWQQLMDWEVAQNGLDQSTLPSRALELHGEATGADELSSVEKLVQLGFGEAQALKALESSAFDLDRALNLLLGES